jgi:hypothetical protein
VSKTGKETVLSSTVHALMPMFFFFFFFIFIRHGSCLLWLVVHVSVLFKFTISNHMFSFIILPRSLLWSTVNPGSSEKQRRLRLED